MDTPCAGALEHSPTYTETHQAMSAPTLTPSAYRNTLLADRIRAELFDMLGCSCQWINEDGSFCGSTDQLQINHLFRREWRPRKLSRYRRNLRYRKEAKAGLLNVLCKQHNEVYRPLPMPTASHTDPF